METNFQKIQRLLFSSDLSAQEQSDFFALFSVVGDESLEPMAELFAEDSSWIRKIYENYKAKQAVFAGKSKALWAEILKGEEMLLQEAAEKK